MMDEHNDCSKQRSLDESDLFDLSRISLNDEDNLKDNPNYSVTDRWKKRREIFQNYLRNKSEFPSQKEMFFVTSPENPSEFHQLIWGKCNDSLEKMQAELGELQTDLGKLQTELLCTKIQEKPTEKIYISVYEKLIAAQEKIIAEREGRIAERKGKIEEREERITHQLNDIINKHLMKQTFLHSLAWQGNETAMTSGKNTVPSIESGRYNKEAFPKLPEEMRRLLVPASGGNGNANANQLKHYLIQKVTGDSGKKVKEDSEKKVKEDLKEKVKNKLCKLHDYVANIMKNGQAGGKIQETVESILSWSDDAEDSADGESKGYCIPLPEGHEEDADQPFLHAVLVKMLHILDHGKTLTREQIVTRLFELEKNRRVDFVAHEIREHLGAIFPAMLDRAIEVKTCPTDAKALEGLYAKGNAQILGHCAKRALCSFDIGGIGEDAEVFGILLTVKSVQITRLTLENVGTQEINLDVTRACANLFATDNEKEDSQDAFLMLAGALHHFHAPGKSMLEKLPMLSSQHEGERWEFLGSGGFCNVIKMNSNSFVKIPKASYFVESLKKEAKVLEELAYAADDYKFPTVVGTGVEWIEGRVGDEMLSIEVLKLRGIIGTTLGQYARQSRELGRIPQIIMKVHNALLVAHGKKIVHRDVRPSNIIIKDAERNGELQVMLSDWGCAFRSDMEGTRKPRFVGCAPYAHDDLFRKNKVEGKNEYQQAILSHTMYAPELDFASLVYTWFSVVKPEEFSVWSSEFDQPPKIFQKQLDKRRNAVVKALDGTGLSSTMGMGLANHEVICLRKVVNTREEWPFKKKRKKGKKRKQNQMGNDGETRGNQEE